MWERSRSTQEINDWPCAENNWSQKAHRAYHALFHLYFKCSVRKRFKKINISILTRYSPQNKTLQEIIRYNENMASEKFNNPTKISSKKPHFPPPLSCTLQQSRQHTDRHNAPDAALESLNLGCSTEDRSELQSVRSVTHLHCTCSPQQDPSPPSGDAPKRLPHTAPPSSCFPWGGWRAFGEESVFTFPYVHNPKQTILAPRKLRNRFYWC